MSFLSLLDRTPHLFTHDDSLQTTAITMSGTPPLTRKRPQCHSCGNPMAGHRRVNGRPVCPNDDDTSNSNTNTTTPSPRRSARLNSQPEEQQTPQPQPPPWTRPGPSNWDSRSRSKSVKRERTASPAPTIMSEEYYKTEDESYYTENDFVGSPSTPQERTSKIGPTSSLRTFARNVRLSTPLASIFTAPRSGVEEVRHEAGRHGMYTGPVYKPRKIKEEEGERWVVMGRDPDDVDSRGTTPMAVGAMAPPIDVACNGPSIWRIFVTLVFAGFFGALILFYMFVYL